MKTEATDHQHPVQLNWRQTMSALAAVLARHGAHASRTVVLVPYAQLMHEAKQAWVAHATAAGSAASAFVPRFETTMNWTTGVRAASGGFKATGDDIRMDAAVDILTAADLLTRAGLAAQQGALAGRLVEAAWSISQVAAAQPPAERLQWGVSRALELAGGMESPSLAFELAVARIALAWASTSSYASDVLFTRQATSQLELLVVLEGFQAEPLTESLKKHFAERTCSIKLPFPDRDGRPGLHAALDAEDEAHRAAACVVAHLCAGRSPVALIAQDRVLTRRVRAMLAERSIALRDETGWKLSTTRAAAGLMSMLRAMPWDASSDAVLDWLKNAPAFGARQVTQLEVELRKAGVRQWRGLPPGNPGIERVAEQVAPLRENLQKTRTLAAWLNSTRAALQTAGQWKALLADAAGSRVTEALQLDRPEVAGIGVANDVYAGVRMTLAEFTAWVSQTLEAANFSPEHPKNAQVVILPLSQLLGRTMQAVVLPGADEVRLAVSPEPPGLWTAAQRDVLGLASREQTASAQRLAWSYALRQPFIDVLWRTSESGESLMPSGFVQEILLERAGQEADDPRVRRPISLQPTPRPLPTGELLPVSRLSASAYEDLRRCPYRFFALRQLRLQDADELENELGKREFGNWLHTLLHRFHEALKAAPASDLTARIAMINVAAEEAKMALGLTDSEFLPFSAIWPRVRNGYLDWLAVHEHSGAGFEEGEVWKTVPLGSVTLVGKLDRIDLLPDGSRQVMDYKTEGRSATQERIKNSLEDTQLAFYAALLEDDTVSAAYVNLGEKEATKTYAQDNIVELRDQLIGSILTDLSRIAGAATLAALGEGKACEYCAARGLCRKDFWAA